MTRAQFLLGVLYRLSAFVLIVTAIYFVFLLAFPPHSHRFKLTVEIDTPGGVRTGSTVIEVERKDVRWVLIAQGRYEFSVRGTAAFIDLGEGRNLFAILAHGVNANVTDQMTSLPMEAYGHDRWDEGVWSRKVKMAGAVELRPPLIPTLVTFGDLTVLESARVVYANDITDIRGGRRTIRETDKFTETFGHGVKLRRVWIEMTTDRLARGFESHLPWWDKPSPWRREMGGYPGTFRVGRGHFVRVR